VIVGDDDPNDLTLEISTQSRPAVSRTLSATTMAGENSLLGDAGRRLRDMPGRGSPVLRMPGREDRRS
jgi:hypothetical protein